VFRATHFGNELSGRFGSVWPWSPSFRRIASKGRITAVVVKIEQFGDELGVVLPEEVLAELKAKDGDRLQVVKTTDGLILKTHDSEFD
jgi:hypothetical protein